MPKSSFAGALTIPRVDVVIDTGNDFLNHTVDGFLKIGAVISAIHFFVFCYVCAVLYHSNLFHQNYTLLAFSGCSNKSSCRGYL